jgi:hypothetical protein
LHLQTGVSELRFGQLVPFEVTSWRVRMMEMGMNWKSV